MIYCITNWNQSSCGFVARFFFAILTLTVIDSNRSILGISWWILASKILFACERAMPMLLCAHYSDFTCKDDPTGLRHENSAKWAGWIHISMFRGKIHTTTSGSMWQRQESFVCNRDSRRCHSFIKMMQPTCLDCLLCSLPHVYVRHDFLHCMFGDVTNFESSLSWWLLACKLDLDHRLVVDHCCWMPQWIPHHEIYSDKDDKNALDLLCDTPTWHVAQMLML